MFFNPLFISNASAGNNVDGTKEGKFTNSNYLFADIINISKENVSLSETNINLDAKNQSLFDSLKSSGTPTSEKNVDGKTNFLGNSESLSSFLSNVLGTKTIENQIALKKQTSKSTDLSVIPEHVAQLVEVLNRGNKVSIPLNNDGKTVFVEIQKYDKSLNVQEPNPKSIKLNSPQSQGIQFSELDFKQIVADISTTLRNSFNLDSSQMSKEKVEAIISKIETSFSNLVSLNNETFQPQKNILGNLISTIEKEFDLSASESGELKTVIVAEFVKVINKTVDNENHKVAEVEASDAFVSLNSVVAKLDLTPKEQAVLNKLNIGVINTNELKGKLEQNLTKFGSNQKLKSILSKFDNYLATNKAEVKTNSVVEKLPVKVIAKELNLSQKEVQLLNKVATEKVSLPELSKELKIEVTKPNATPELKGFVQKLDKYIATNKVEVKANSVVEKLPIKTITKELNLSPKEVELLNKVATEKVSLPELSKELKIEVTKPKATPELKGFVQKLDKYLATNKVKVKADSIVEKLPVKVIAKELNLSPKEVQLLNKVATEKVSLPELSKELKVEATKPNATPELKGFVQKLDKYIATNKAEVKADSVVEKLPVKVIAKELNLSPKEVQLLNKVATEKVSLPELSKELKVEATKPNATPELKGIVQKLDKYIATNKVEVKADSVVEKLPIKAITKELNLSPKEVQLLNKVATEKVSLPELSKELKVEVTNPTATPELKGFVQKLDKYIATNKAEVKADSVVEKLPVKVIAKELNLNPKEVQLLNKVATEKVSLPELSKELKVEVTKPNATPELKGFVQKLDKYIATNKVEVKTDSGAKKLPVKTIANELNVDVKTISKTLNLTPTESKLIRNLGIEKIDFNKLKEFVKSEVLNNPKQPELKSLSSKLEKFEISTNNDLTKIVKRESEVGLIQNKKATAKSKIIKKVKSGIKNIIANTNSEVKINNSKTEYLFTLKNERTNESLAVDKDLKVEKKNHETLKKSIYTSKESAELTNLKLVPIGEGIRKFELGIGDHSYKKGIIRKVLEDGKVSASSESNKESSSKNNGDFKNEQSLSDQNIVASKHEYGNSSSKTVIKETQNYSEVASKSESLSTKKSTHETSINETKVSEVSTPKTSVVEHQLRQNLFNTTEKVIRKNVDIKNIKEEVSNLIQKGEKKLVEFNLNPENLGKIAIKLEVINKVVTASIKVENEMTQQIIQNSLEGLKTSLNQNGVQFNALNVSLSNSEDKNQRYFKQKRKNSRVAKMNIEGFDEKFSHKNLGYNKYDFIA